MRTINTTLIRVEPYATVAPACPSLRENSALLQNSASKLPSLAVFGSPLSWPAAAAAAAPAAVTARPKSRVAATGVGYAGPDAAETRLNGINGTNGKQQDQLHLMSRRDPRSWRPPA